MTLLLPAGIRQIAGDPRHPYYRPEANMLDFVFFVNEVEQRDVIVADEINGYVKKMAGDRARVLKNKRATKLVSTIRVKGKVQIYVRKGKPDVA